jgi:hypothetical protein
MAKIAGISFIKDTKGKKKKIVIDIKKHYELVEDLLDHLDVVALKDEETIPLEDAKKDIKKYFSKKRKSK